MNNPMERKLALVKWTDAHNNGGQWLDPTELDEFTKDDIFQTTNVGWVVRENDDCIVLAARHDRDFDQVGMVERIPKKMVEEIKYL